MVLRIIFLSLVLSACKPTPFSLKPITKKQIVLEDNKLKSLDAQLIEGIRQKYLKVGSPTFAIVRGNYRLPETRPYGAVSIVQGFSYQTEIKYLNLEAPRHPYAIENLDGDEAISLNEAINSLLDARVKILELSMSDAGSIAKAEKEAINSNSKLKLSEVLPVNADYLISINESGSELGPVLIGRVIKRDGTLLAFRVIQKSKKHLTGSLVTTLFEDCINRL